MPRNTARANAAKSAVRAAVRARVEHPFAHQKGFMGLVTIGRAREAAVTMANMANMAYNMKRWCWLDRRNAPA